MTVRSTPLDRAGALRIEADALERLRASETTEVVVIRDRRARIDGETLATVSPSQVGPARWALLGRRADGSAILLAAVDDVEDEISVDAVPDETWMGLRDVGGILDPASTELLIEALAMAGWLRDASFCPACGGTTELQQAGWSRQCTVCGRVHFPRTDPAVIVAIESADGERLLLGANAQWRGRMFSCFAGFVEAGESLESTLHREIEEEAGVRLSAVRYVSSQPWPFPRSLMIGFRAVAEDEHIARPDGEEILEVRWFTRDEIGSALAGAGPVGLPGPTSIARALIREWYEDRA